MSELAPPPPPPGRRRVMRQLENAIEAMRRMRDAVAAAPADDWNFVGEVSPTSTLLQFFHVSGLPSREAAGALAREIGQHWWTAGDGTWEGVSKFDSRQRVIIYDAEPPARNVTEVKV
jgi:hypothetical protein